MLIILVRTVILYLTVLIVMRIMGKAELSKMSPFQLIVVFMIAELASIPIESSDISLITGVTAIFTLTFLQVLISYISLHCERFKLFFGGQPSILIDNGEINYKELKNLRITINDLMQQLRIGNAPSISEIEYAIMEANGELSIIQKSSNKPLTPKDVAMNKERESMPTVLISDGVIYKQNITRTGRTESTLIDELVKLNITDYKKAFLVFSDSNSKLHVFVKDDNEEMAVEVTK